MGPFSLISLAQIGPISWHMTVIEGLEQCQRDLNRVPTPERILISDITRFIPGLFRELCPMFIPTFLKKSRVLLTSWKFRL